MDFKYNYDTMGLIGRKGTGKTYLTKQLASKVPMEKVMVLDSRNQYPEYKNRDQPKLNERNVEKLDSFIKSCYKYTDRLVIFDDLDLYLKHPNESDWLANFLIDAGSKSYLGCIWQAKRLTNMDLRLLSESHYIVVGKGVLPNDLEKLFEIGMDTDQYMKVIVPAENQYIYILYDVFTQQQKVITGF